MCVCVYTYIQTLSPSACPFPIQPAASPRMISVLTSGACLFAKHMFFLSTHGPSYCPNYFWHHQESSWPTTIILWPIPLSSLSESFTSKFLFLLMHRGKRKMHEVLTYMQSDPLSPALITFVHSPCYLCLLPTRCELLLNSMQLNAQHSAHLALTPKHLGCNFYSNTIQNDASFLSNFPFKTSKYSSSYTVPLFSTFFAPQHFSSIVSIWCE